jgi:hypothetical protein
LFLRVLELPALEVDAEEADRLVVIAHALVGAGHIEGELGALRQHERASHLLGGHVEPARGVRGLAFREQRARLGDFIGRGLCLGGGRPEEGARQQNHDERGASESHRA